MTTPPHDQPSHPSTLTIHTSDGSTLPGYVIRQDTVLMTQPATLALPLEVELPNGPRHDVTAIHLTAKTGAAGNVLCALSLPENTVTADASLCPPENLLPQGIVCPDEDGAVRSLWCRLFPGIPGC